VNFSGDIYFGNVLQILRMHLRIHFNMYPFLWAIFEMLKKIYKIRKKSVDKQMY